MQLESMPSSHIEFWRWMHKCVRSPILVVLQAIRSTRIYWWHTWRIMCVAVMLIVESVRRIFAATVMPRPILVWSLLMLNVSTADETVNFILIATFTTCTLARHYLRSFASVRIYAINALQYSIEKMCVLEVLTAHFRIVFFCYVCLTIVACSFCQLFGNYFILFQLELPVFFNLLTRFIDRLEEVVQVARHIFVDFQHFAWRFVAFDARSLTFFFARLAKQMLAVGDIWLSRNSHRIVGPIWTIWTGWFGHWSHT